MVASVSFGQKFGSASLAAALLAACTGTFGNAEGDSDRGFGRGGPNGSAIAGENGTSPGLRRLTRFEYGRTVQDLIGVAGAEAPLTEGGTVNFLSNNAFAQQVGLADLEGLSRAATDASKAAAAKVKLPANCELDTLTEPCVETFLQGFLRNAFRRPPAKEEIARYVTVFTNVKALFPAAEAFRSVLEAVLFSPHFLYRDEVATKGRLSSYAVASRLSYLLWSTMPDEALFAAAAANGLEDPATIEAQVRRMLSDPRAKEGVVRFTGEWLGFGKAQVNKKGQDILKDLPATLPADLEQETRLFVGDALLGPTHSLSTLLTATSSFVNETVARVYGISGVKGEEFRRVELDGKTRRGVLTQPLLIAAHSKESGYSVVQMGRFVRERLLCQTVPPPPPGVSTVLDVTNGPTGLSFRERFSDHSKNPSCSGCHQTLDPPGYAYLPFDPLGRYLETSPQGGPFVTNGTLTQLDGASVDFTNNVQMIDAIAASRTVYDCFSRMYLQYAYGRNLASVDAPLHDGLTTALVASRGDFVAFVVALIRSPDFGTPGPQLLAKTLVITLTKKDSPPWPTFAFIDETFSRVPRSPRCSGPLFEPPWCKRRRRIQSD